MTPEADADVRVLYSFPHRVGAPGIGITALNQVRGLAAAGAKVTLICTSLHGDVPASVDVRETLRIRGRRIPHRAFGSPDLALVYHDHWVARSLRRSADDFDVVHTWPQSALATLQAARAVGCLSSREVPNAHTAEAYEQAAVESDILGVELKRGHSHRPNPRRLHLEQREYDAVDLLMVPSRHVEATFLARGFGASRLARHQYGFDPTRFGPEGRADRPERPFTGVFVGSAEPRKGLHYVLRAWSKADLPPTSRLLVAGAFASGYREAIADLIDRPWVETLGFISDVPALLRQSDALLLPSVEEGSALVTYEAQACGSIPIVSSAAGALLPPSMHAYVHEPRDVETLTRHLHVIGNDEGLRSRLRADILGWSPRLTWDAAGRRMLDIYRSRLHPEHLGVSDSGATDPGRS